MRQNLELVATQEAGLLGNPKIFLLVTNVQQLTLFVTLPCSHSSVCVMVTIHVAVNVCIVCMVHVCE